MPMLRELSASKPTANFEHLSICTPAGAKWGNLSELRSGKEVEREKDVVIK